MSTDNPLDIPVSPVPIADTHAHLDMLEDPAGALERAARAGVSLVVTVVDPTEDANRTFDELDAWRATAAESLGRERQLADSSSGAAQLFEVPAVRIIVGAHPHNAKDFNDHARERLLGLASSPLVAGIGEVGLDYHYDYSPREVQRSVFAEQLDLARQLGLPAIIHLRDAYDDGEAIMRDVGLPPGGCVLHCFTGDAELVDRFLDMGCYVSFAGPVTFKKADAIREAATKVPLDRLLVETDCPFMAPEPYRGRKNEPALTVLTANRIAQLRGIDESELALATSANARRLFGIGV